MEIKPIYYDKLKKKNEELCADTRMGFPDGLADQLMFNLRILAMENNVTIIDGGPDMTPDDNHPVSIQDLADGESALSAVPNADPKFYFANKYLVHFQQVSMTGPKDFVNYKWDTMVTRDSLYLEVHKIFQRFNNMCSTETQHSQHCLMAHTAREQGLSLEGTFSRVFLLDARIKFEKWMNYVHVESRAYFGYVYTGAFKPLEVKADATT